MNRSIAFGTCLRTLCHDAFARSAQRLPPLPYTAPVPPNLRKPSSEAMISAIMERPVGLEGFILRHSLTQASIFD
jgi:hypothetical protein